MTNKRARVSGIRGAAFRRLGITASGVSQDAPDVRTPGPDLVAANELLSLARALAPISKTMEGIAQAGVEKRDTRQSGEAAALVAGMSVEDLQDQSRRQWKEIVKKNPELAGASPLVRTYTEKLVGRRLGEAYRASWQNSLTKWSNSEYSEADIARDQAELLQAATDGLTVNELAGFLPVHEQTKAQVTAQVGAARIADQSKKLDDAETSEVLNILQSGDYENLDLTLKEYHAASGRSGRDILLKAASHAHNAMVNEYRALPEEERTPARLEEMVADQQEMMAAVFDREVNGVVMTESAGTTLVEMQGKLELFKRQELERIEVYQDNNERENLGGALHASAAAIEAGADLNETVDALQAQFPEMERADIEHRLKVTRAQRVEADNALRAQEDAASYAAATSDLLQYVGLSSDEAVTLALKNGVPSSRIDSFQKELEDYKAQYPDVHTFSEKISAGQVRLAAAASALTDKEFPAEVVAEVQALSSEAKVLEDKIRSGKLEEGETMESAIARLEGIYGSMNEKIVAGVPVFVNSTYQQVAPSLQRNLPSIFAGEGTEDEVPIIQDIAIELGEQWAADQVASGNMPTGAKLRNEMLGPEFRNRVRAEYRIRRELEAAEQARGQYAVTGTKAAMMSREDYEEHQEATIAAVAGEYGAEMFADSVRQWGSPKSGNKGVWESEAFRMTPMGEGQSPRAALVNPTPEQIDGLVEMTNFVPVNPITVMSGSLEVPMEADGERAVVTAYNFRRPIDGAALLFYGFDREALEQVAGLKFVGAEGEAFDAPAKSTAWLDAIRAGVATGRITVPPGMTWRDVAALQVNRGLADYDLQIRDEEDFGKQEILKANKAKVAAYYADLGIENIVQ